MNLFDKIRAIYPEIDLLKEITSGSICLRNDGDDRGDYIAQWNHPTSVCPTQEQLNAIVDAKATEIATLKGTV